MGAITIFYSLFIFCSNAPDPEVEEILYLYSHEKSYFEEAYLGLELASQSNQLILQKRIPYNRLTIYPNRYVQKK